MERFSFWASFRAMGLCPFRTGAEGWHWATHYCDILSKFGISSLSFWKNKRLVNLIPPGPWALHDGQTLLTFYSLQCSGCCAASCWTVQERKIVGDEGCWVSVCSLMHKEAAKSCSASSCVSHVYHEAAAASWKQDSGVSHKLFVMCRWFHLLT